jgi:hypothetical protein
LKTATAADIVDCRQESDSLSVLMGRLDNAEVKLAMKTAGTVKALKTPNATKKKNSPFLIALRQPAARMAAQPSF